MVLLTLSFVRLLSVLIIFKLKVLILSKLRKIGFLVLFFRKVIVMLENYECLCECWVINFGYFKIVLNF